MAGGMTTPDPNYFGEHGPEIVHLPPGSRVEPFRWCKCGHVEGVHFEQPQIIVSAHLAMAEPFRCHAKRRKSEPCSCTKFRLRKPSRLRRLWNGKG